MSKKCLVLFLESVGLQIIFAGVSMVFFISVIPPWLYSLFTAWLFLWSLHSTYWKLGNKHRKQNIIYNNNLPEGETKKKMPFYRGALFATPFLVFNIIILLLTYITNNNLMVIAQSVLFAPFAGFLPVPSDMLDSAYLLSRLVVCFVMYLTCALAYVSGMFNYSFFDKYYRKIIYKTPQNPDIQK